MDDVQLIERYRSEVPERDEVARTNALRTLDNHWAGRGRSRSRRRHLVVPAAGVVIAGAVLAVVLTTDIGGGPVRVEPAAAAVLERAAESAAARGLAGAIPDGKAWYQHSRARYLTVVSGKYSYMRPSEGELWVRADGSGRDLRTTGAAEFLTPQARDAWAAAGDPLVLGADTDGDQRLGPGSSVLLYNLGDRQLTYREMLALPADPTRLADLVAKGVRRCKCGQSFEQEQFVVVGDFLRAPAVPARLRAAFFKVAAQLPGIATIGPATDAAGRTGVAIARLEPYGQRNELIFDPETGDLLGERSVITTEQDVDGTGGRVPAGTVTGEVAYLQSGLVDSLTDRPRG